MGSQKWKLQKMEKDVSWAPLLDNLKHSHPKECTMYVRVTKLNCQGLSCRILVLASFIQSSIDM